MDSLQGQLLIAAPSLLDPNFAQTVVLIAAHGDEGALGLILNREMSMRLPQVWEQISQSPCLRDESVRHGGPVSGSLMTVHDQRSLANLVVTDELYVATELNAMEVLAASDEGQAVFFVGHSGWGPGQLESELADGSWVMLPARPEHVFEERDTLTFWKEAITEAGRRQVQSVIPLRHIPQDPRLN
jgi:putative transcriptional regulator